MFWFPGLRPMNPANASSASPAEPLDLGRARRSLVGGVPRPGLWLAALAAAVVIAVAGTAIFVGVFGVMFYSIYAHRKSVGHKAEHFHENITRRRHQLDVLCQRLFGKTRNG